MAKHLTLKLRVLRTNSLLEELSSCQSLRSFLMRPWLMPDSVVKQLTNLRGWSNICPINFQTFSKKRISTRMEALILMDLRLLSLRQEIFRIINLLLMSWRRFLIFSQKRKTLLMLSTLLSKILKIESTSLTSRTCHLSKIQSMPLQSLISLQFQTQQCQLKPLAGLNL